MESRESPKLRVTKDYSVFVHSRDNRPLKLEKREKLKESMETHGFIPGYPLNVIRTSSSKLEIRDGQNRFAIAQQLGLQVWYVISDDKVSIPEINNTQIPWNLRDYAMCFAEKDNAHYREVVEFSDRYRIPISTSAQLLGAGGHYTRALFCNGGFKIKNAERAHKIANAYRELTAISGACKNSRLMQALYACTYVPEFDPRRLVDNARRCPEKLQSYSTSEAFLIAIEEIYNYGRQKKEAIKVPAENAMRARNPRYKNQKEDAQVSA